MSATVRPTYRPRAGVQRHRIRATPPPPQLASLSRSLSPAVTNARTCRVCGSTNLGEDNGNLVCLSCAVVVDEDPGFRAEQEFDEAEGGRAVQRGTRVGENQTHQRQFTSRIPGQSRYGPGLEQTPLAEKAKSEAQSVFQRYAALLEIRQPEINAAMEIFKLSYNRGFYRGRTLTSVAVACLYLAIRRAQQPYPLMLIDFAELDNFNVFDLGKMCQDLKKTLYLDQAANDGSMDENETAKVRMVDPEHLIEKFCDRLDFGLDERKIKLDAIRLVKCMKRDWMSHGRRPAGVAGAAVILAARMNNYRRTLREVVLVAKVAELTVSKRIEEFQETKSGSFSVKEFRQHDIDSVQGPDVQDPPAYYRTKPEYQKPKKKRGRPRKNALPETAAEIEGDGSLSDDQHPNEPPHKRARIDADGFAVPALPQRETGASRLGRPPGARNWRAPPPTEAELEVEDELTHDIQEQLDENVDLDPTREQETEQEVQPVSPPALPTPPSSAPRASKGPLGPAVNTSVGNIGHVSLSPTLKATEFEDDLDVANCVLSSSEKRNKEIIWVTENADWLRQENAKRVRQELKDKELREKGIDPEKERAKNKAKRRKDGMMKSGRTGDVSYLDKNRDKDGQTTDDQNRRERSASESVLTMLQQRGKYSRRVDYEKLANAYKLPGAEDSESRSPSRSASVETEREGSVLSVASNTAPPSTAFFLPYKAKGQAGPKSTKDSRERASRSPTAQSEAGAALDRSRSATSVSPEIDSAAPALLPAEEVIDSPLSSTNTPAGYGSGGPKRDQEEDSEGDDDDYWDEDEGNEPEDDPDKFFAQPATWIGEEEVVED